MLNFRHERYCWVPREPLGVLRGAGYEERALIAYLTKLVDPRTGALAIGSTPPFRALVMACAVHPLERRAFSELVPRVLARPGIRLEGGALTLADFSSWQRTREPSRRLYATEPPEFTHLPAWARFLAAEMIRTADDRGVVWVGSVESYARHHADVATAQHRDPSRGATRRRILAGLRALVMDGFLLADSALRVRNFETAQARVERRAARGTSPRPAPDVTPTSPRPIGPSVRNHTTPVAQTSALPTSPTLPSPTKYTEAPDTFGGTPAAPPGFSSKGERGGQPTLPGVPTIGGAEQPRRRTTGGVRRAEPPFGVADALGAIESTSKGRFVAGSDAQWPRSVLVRVEGHVRAFGTLPQWRTLGAWLAQGGDAYRGVLGPAWAASDALADAMVRSGAWATRTTPTEPAPARSPDEIDVVVARSVNLAAGVRVVALDPLAKGRGRR